MSHTQGGLERCQTHTVVKLVFTARFFSSGEGLPAGAGVLLPAAAGSTARPLSRRGGLDVVTRGSKRLACVPPTGLAAAVVGYCAANDTLVVAGGLLNGERTKTVHVLQRPADAAAVWGAPHKAVLDLQSEFADKTVGLNPYSQHPAVAMCSCADTGRYYSFNWSQVNPETRKPHRAAVGFARQVMGYAQVTDFPGLSVATTVAASASVFGFGGKTMGGKINRDVVEVSSVPDELSRTRTVSVYAKTTNHNVRVREFSSTTAVSVHRITLNTWLPSLGAAGAKHGNDIYLIGGLYEGEAHGAIFMFSVQTKKMRTFPVSVGRLPPLAFAAAAAVRDQIAVFGGQSASKQNLNNLFLIHTTAGSIDRVVIAEGLPPTPRSRHWMATCGDDLWIGGGLVGDDNTPDENGGIHILKDVTDLQLERLTLFSFDDMLNSDKLADVLIVNGTERVWTHRVVLAARNALMRRALSDAVADEPDAVLLNNDRNDVRLSLANDINDNDDDDDDDVASRTMRVQRRKELFTLRVAAPHAELMALLRYFYTDSVDLDGVNLDALQRLAVAFSAPALAKMCAAVRDESVVVPASTFLADFTACINNAATGDAVFDVDGRAVHAHRAVLVHRCAYFDMLLGGAFREASAALVTIVDVDSEVFLAGLRFLYTGSVDAASPQALFDLLYVSDLWQLDALKAKLEPLLLEHLEPYNATIFYQAAVDTRCSAAFRDRVLQFVKTKFAALLGAAVNGTPAAIFELVETRLDAASDAEAEVAAAAPRSAFDAARGGWLPRAEVQCSGCDLPSLFSPATWPADRKTPLQLVNDLVTDQKTDFSADFVPGSARGVGHSVDCKLGDGRVVHIVRSFASRRIAKQNAALMVLHHLHS